MLPMEAKTVTSGRSVKSLNAFSVSWGIAAAGDKIQEFADAASHARDHASGVRAGPELGFGGRQDGRGGGERFNRGLSGVVSLLGGGSGGGAGQGRSGVPRRGVGPGGAGE